MSYVVSVDVSSEQLTGIQATLAEGLGEFVIAADKLKTAGAEVKGQLNVVAEIATIKKALTDMSGAIATASTAEILKISSAMAEIGTSLHNVAISIDNVRVGDRLQASVDGFVTRFAEAMNASLTHNHGSNTTPTTGTPATPTVTMGGVDLTSRVDEAIKTKDFGIAQKIDIGSRIDTAILAKHFNIVNKIDLTDRVNFNIHAGIFTTKAIDLTARIQLAVDAMQIGASTEIKVKKTTTPTDVKTTTPVEHTTAPISILGSQLSFTPITISAEDLLSKISIASVNIRELVIEALEGNGGKVNLYDLVADEISAGLRNNSPAKSSVAESTITSTDAGLEAIVKLFEEFRASSETEMLAARDQYAELEKTRQTISKVNTKFISLGGSITDTIALFSGINDSIKIVGDKFIELANNVAIGETKPTEVANKAKIITEDQALNQTVKWQMFTDSKQYHDAKNSSDFEDPYKRDNIVANRAYKLRERGAKIATTPGISQENIDTLAKDLLHFGESISKLDDKIKNEAAGVLGLNDSGKNALFNPNVEGNRTKLTKTAFIKNSGIDQIPNIAKTINAQMSSPDYLNPRNYGGDLEASAGDNIRDLGRLERGKGKGSNFLKELINKAYERASSTANNNEELINEFEKLTNLPEYHDKLDHHDKQILAGKISKQRENLQPQVLDSSEAEKKVANLITTFRSFYETTLNTIDEVASDFKSGANKVAKVAADTKAKVDKVVRPVVRAVEVARDSAVYYQQLKDTQKANKAIDVKATEVKDDEQPTRPTAPALVTRPPKPPIPPVSPAPPSPPSTTDSNEEEEPSDKYRIEAGIVRNRFKHGNRQDLERVQAATANENPRIQELQEADFVNLQKEQYLTLLKHNLKIVASGDATAAKAAEAEVNVLRAELSAEPVNTQVAFNTELRRHDREQRKKVTQSANYDNASGAPIDLNSISSEESGVKDLSRLKLIERNLKSRLGNILSQQTSLDGIDRAYQQFIVDNFNAVAQIDNTHLDKITDRHTAKLTVNNKRVASDAAKDFKQIYDLTMLDYKQAIEGKLKGNIDGVNDAANNIVDPVQKKRAKLDVYRARNKARQLEEVQPQKDLDEERQAFDAQHRLLKSKFNRGLEIDTTALSPTNSHQREQLAGLNQKIDEQVTKSLEDLYKNIVKNYLSQLKLAIANAKFDNTLMHVAAPVLPPNYLGASNVQIQELSYQKSQTAAVDRNHKAKAVELRDTGTLEALAELEVGFAQRLFGYASAMRQLRAELNRATGGSSPFDTELKRLRIEVRETGKMPNLDALNEAIDFAAPQALIDKQIAQISSVEKELAGRVEQIADIKFNKRLSKSKVNIKANGTDAFSNDERELESLATTQISKDKFKLYLAEIDEKFNKSATDIAERRKKQIIQTAKDSGFKLAESQLTRIEASYLTQGSPIPQQLKDARTKIEADFQKAILADVRHQISLAQAAFDPATDRSHLSGAQIKANVSDYNLLTDRNKIVTESQILASQQTFRTQTKQYDNHEFNLAKDAAKYNGDLSQLSDIHTANVSTKAKEAGAELNKMLADLAKMSAEERQHIAEVRAQMNAARSDVTEDKVDLIHAAINETKKLVPPKPGETANSSVYLNTLKTLENQGLKTIHQEEKTDDVGHRSTNIQDIAGYYYTLKSIASTVSESLHKLSEAAIATTRAMMLLEVANDNNITRTNKDIAASEGLSRDFGGAANDYKALIGSFKAGTPLEYDKQGERVPSKLNDDQVVSIVRNLQAASVVNHLDTQQTGQLNLAVQEILSKNQVQSKELVRQLGNVIPGAVPKFAQAQGMSTKELRNAMEQGNVGLDAFVRFTDKLGEVYGEKAKKGTLIKELNILAGNTKQINETGAGAIAPLAQVSLSAVNTILEGIKVNMGTLALVALPATIAALTVLSKTLIYGFVRNNVAETYINTAKATISKNLLPLGAGVLGFGISAIGSKALGEQTLDSVLDKLGTKLGYIFDKINEKFKGNDKEHEKSTTEYSTTIGGSLVGLAALQAIRANFNKGLDYGTNLPTGGLGGLFSNIKSGLGNATDVLKTAFGKISNVVSSVTASVNNAPSNLRANISRLNPIESIKTFGSDAVDKLNQGLAIADKAMVNLGDKLHNKGTSGFIKFGQAIDNIETNLKNATAFTKAALSNPFGGMIMAEHHLRTVVAPKINEGIKGLTDKIGGAVSNLTSNIGGKITGAIASVNSAFSSMGEKLKNLNASGSLLAKMGFGRDTAAAPLTEQEHAAKANLGNIAGDLGLSFVTTVAAIAIANTTFVSDYSLAMEEVIKKIRSVKFGLTATNNTSTTDELLKGEQAGEFNTDIPTKLLRDGLAAMSGDFKSMTAERLRDISESKQTFGEVDLLDSRNQASIELKRRRNGGVREKGGLATNLENSQTNSQISTNEAFEETDSAVAAAMDNSKFTEDVIKSNAALAKLNKLRDDNLARMLDSQRTGKIIDPGEQEKTDTLISNATNEYNLAAARLNKRRPVIIEAIKSANAQIERATEDPLKNFGSKEKARDAIKSAQNRKLLYEKDLADVEKNVSDVYDSVSSLTKATNRFQQLNKIIERRGNIQAITDADKSSSSIKKRLTEGDELMAGDRKATYAATTAYNGLVNSQEKAKLADEQVQTINHKPPGEEQAKELQSAMDAQIEAHKAVAAAQTTLAQATLDKANQREQGLITSYDNDQNALNNQFNRYTSRVRTGYAPSLNTRNQPEIDATIADQLDNAATVKAKETYLGKLKIEKSIIVNRRAFLQGLAQAKTEYENAVESLTYNRQLREKDRIVRGETNTFQDLDRGFNRLDTAMSERRQDRIPQNVAFSEINFKRDTANSGVAQSKDDLAVGGDKIKAMAIAISKISSPQLKIEKDLEYAKMLADFKKKQFDVESAVIAQIKQKYEEVKNTISEIGSFRGEILANRGDALKEKATRQYDADQYRAVGTSGETNTIESAKAKVTEAQTIADGLQAAIDGALTTGQKQIDTYARSFVNNLPDDDPTKKQTVDRIDSQINKIGEVSKMLFTGGKEGRGLMATDLNILTTQFSSAFSKFKLRPETTDKSVGTLRLNLSGKDASFTGTQGELELIQKVLENFKVPLKKKNDDETSLVAARRGVDVATKKIKEELRVGAENVEKTKLESDSSQSDYDRKFTTGFEQFDKELKLVHSKAPDAKNYTDAVKLEAELKEELTQRDPNVGKNRAAKNAFDLNQIENDYKAKSATDPLDIAINKKNYEDKLQAKLKQIKDSEISASEKLIEAMKSQTLAYLSLSEASKGVFKQMAASLLTIQTAGITLLKSYGVLAGEVELVSFHKNDKNEYEAKTRKFNADDEGQLASAEAAQKVEAHNDSIDEFKVSAKSLQTANTPEALASVISTAKSFNDPKLTFAADKIEAALKAGTPFDSTQIAHWIELLVAASKNLVKISDEKLAEIERNAANIVNYKKDAEFDTVNSETDREYIKSRQGAFRHGAVESTGDIRDMDDRTTRIYENKLAAVRAETAAAVIEAGGATTDRGRLANQKGLNKESDIQNEYADLPLYGKQFSSDIADAVGSAAKFSTVMREAIEKGSWGEAFNSMMRNLLNKLSDTYSDRAAKQLGDLVRGQIDGLFGLNNPLGGGADKIAASGKSILGNLGGGGISQEKGDLSGFQSLFEGLFSANGGKGTGSFVGDMAKDGNWLNSVLGGTENLFGLSQGSIPSLSMGDIPSYADGKPGTLYPKTPVQDSREPTSSRLAVINADELVLSRGQVEGYQNYKNEVANNSVMNHNSNNRSTVNNYQTSNISMSNADTFGQSDYSFKQGTKSRFDKK